MLHVVCLWLSEPTGRQRWEATAVPEAREGLAAFATLFPSSSRFSLAQSRKHRGEVHALVGRKELPPVAGTEAGREGVGAAQQVSGRQPVWGGCESS